MSFQPFYPDQAFYATSHPVAPAPIASAKRVSRDPAAKQKPTKRSCRIAGCSNGVVQGGVCVSHGAKRRQCDFPGCTKSSKCAGMCSKHGPRQAPCDEEGCTRISIRGTKCKLHADPSKKCAIGGCRKGSVVGGMCKRHQDEFKSTSASQALDAAVPTPTIPTLCMPVQASYPMSTVAQAMAQQSMLSNIGMFPFLAYPTVPSMMFPYGSGYGGMGIGAYEGGVYASQTRPLNSLASDALMMLELAKQRSRQQNISVRKFKHLSSK